MLSLVSRRPEQVGPRDDAVIYEVLLPINVYWQVEEQIKDLDYKRSNFDDAVSIGQLHRQILGQMANYITTEKERMQLKAALNGTQNK